MVQANTIDAGLGTKPVPRLALTMSVPTIVAQAANAPYTIIDRLFIGHIPEVGNAADDRRGHLLPDSAGRHRLRLADRRRRRAARLH